MRRPFAGASLVVLFSGWALSQSNPPPAFDVADIQLSKARPGDPPRGRFVNSRVDLANVTIRQLITAAYSLGDDDVKGGPSWLDTDKFDIVAKAPPNTKEAVLRQMLATLLVERFKLVFHKEDKVKQVYALVVAKGGPKLQQAAGDTRENCGAGEGAPDMIHLDCKGISMATLALFLPRAAPRWVDAPVVDQTELNGAYDFHLDWHGRPQATDSSAATDPGLISMFDAIAKLGLKLEPRKLPMPVYVVDSVERTPTEQE